LVDKRKLVPGMLFPVPRRSAVAHTQRVEEIEARRQVAVTLVPEPAIILARRLLSISAQLR
jgi:hypothetical protein